MLLHKPTKQLFNNRKEIKNHFGVHEYRKMIKRKEIQFLNAVAINYEEIQCKNHREDKESFINQ